MDRFSSMLRKDMDVYDAKGDKVGKVGEIYQPTAVSSTTSSVGQATGRTYFKVDTGFLKLGEDLYIPADEITDVTGDRVILNTDKDHLDAMGWDHRPDFLR